MKSDSEAKLLPGTCKLFFFFLETYFFLGPCHHLSACCKSTDVLLSGGTSPSGMKAQSKDCLHTMYYSAISKQCTLYVTHAKPEGRTAESTV